ncbi:MAG: hypothetical protein NTV34_12200 [Proteobacteria bacterium]|nr:hypothetical protein [Pseudomonadota bacterium]
MKVFNLSFFNERLDELKQEVETKGFCILKNYASKEEVADLLSFLGSKFKIDQDVRVSGNYYRNMPDIQRLDIGEFKSSSRFCRYFFTFPWNSGRGQELAKKLIQLTNKITNVPDAFHDEDADRFLTSFFIQYPVGGGFMSGHREYAIKSKADNAFVLYIPLTTKSKNFNTGGAFVYNRENEKICIDDFCEAGDLVIYDGSALHGVESIDIRSKPDLDTLSGRIIFVATTEYIRK